MAKSDHNSLSYCIETAKENAAVLRRDANAAGREYKPVSIMVIGYRWFDRVNGNTYHSAMVYFDGQAVARAPFQYGYGDQYVSSALEIIRKAGLLDCPEGTPLWQYCRDNGITFTYQAHDGLKRDAMRNR